MRPQNFRGNVFVANLPDGYSDEKLAAIFDPFGIVLSAFVARDPETGRPQSYGLVNLAPERAVAEAIAELNGSDLDGRPLQVRPADPDKGLTVPSARRPMRSAPPPHAAPARARPTFQVEHIRSGRRTSSPGGYR